jgi:hypothetical protein
MLDFDQVLRRRGHSADGSSIDGASLGRRRRDSRTGRLASKVGRMRGRLFLLTLLTVCLIAFVAFVGTLDRSEAPRLTIVGRPETVFDWSRSACEPIDIPDAPARAFRDVRGQVHLFASHYVTRAMVGPSLDRLSRDCKVVMSSSENANPALFNDRAWLSAPYTPDGRSVYALVHDEYQGYTHPGQCRFTTYRHCWYNALTFAVSHDGGRTFTAPPSPANVVASSPYAYVPDSRPYGIFAPSNVVHRNGFYYVLVRAGTFGDQHAGTCLMRTNNLAEPASWRAWDGGGFNVQFMNPYRETVNDPGNHVCRPVARDEISDMTGGLTYNTYLDRFVLVGTAGASQPTDWGIYYSVSKDLIHWSPRRLAMRGVFPWIYKCGEENPIAYPSILDPNSSSRNFDTADKRAYLYLTRFHYNRCKQTLDRDLLRIPIEFSK